MRRAEQMITLNFIKENLSGFFSVGGGGECGENQVQSLYSCHIARQDHVYQDVLDFEGIHLIKVNFCTIVT